MNKLLLIFITLSVFILQSSAQEKLLEILETEVQRELEELKDQEIPPYFISYRVEQTQSFSVHATFGTLAGTNKTEGRLLTTMVRVGSKELDNFHQLRETSRSNINQRATILPIEDSPEAIAQVLWNKTNSEYLEAVSKLTKVKGNIAVKVEEEDKSIDFSTENPVKYYEEPIDISSLGFDKEQLIEKVKKYSAVFFKNKDIYQTNSSIYINNMRKYYVSSEGTVIAENLPTVQMYISANLKADDGMELPLYKSYFGFKMEDLPSDEQVLKDANEIAEKLALMKDAPIVEPYTGPALLSGSASGVFFHEIFGHRIEGARQKKSTDAQTFKKKVGDEVLPKDLSVIFDPSVKEYKGFLLNGYYKYDDEGIKGQKVTVIENGILKDFLMCRTPLEGFNNSNGHGRAQAGYQTVSRQSNLILESDNLLAEEKLRKAFIKELKKENLEFGFLFETVQGGFTMTGRYIPNAFNVTPLEVYRIYADGRPDELVRGIDLVGTPLAMFSEIEAAGGEYGVFNGTCGAESGRIPVSSITPMLFVKKIEIQKKPKSSEKPKILERPDVNNE